MAEQAPSDLPYEEFEPFCEWKRLEDSDVLQVHLAEFKKEELRVRIKNNSVLTLSGERLAAEDWKKIRFNSEIKLPKDTLPDQIRAKFGDSVLSITMPKKKASPASIDNACPRNFISGVKSSLARLKFSKESAVAMAVAGLILASGAYYLIENAAD
ncbi:17.8 kDa class I heat shock protein-like [Cucurbita pepo subsp. pepo]|uniref:17.8 kDa class I heat shock protein-like n=1 Tax=Cucurbita pepo subsp. pepo TaxID=3664 RepID=UPI000C9D56F3|nr:17.8 kDa class I heat shock protein-like [Cucurbita pepo subsp. pepo]